MKAAGYRNRKDPTTGKRVWVFVGNENIEPREVNTERNAKCKAKYDARIAAGYRYRKDPTDGKHRWIFVGKEAV